MRTLQTMPPSYFVVNVKLLLLFHHDDGKATVAWSSSSARVSIVILPECIVGSGLLSIIELRRPHDRQEHDIVEVCA